ncbi:MAG TPA: O-antigen ligase family protein [Taishania sp.]|nr:O-antigen ligase family protein [Taishania sp.]
MQQGIFSQRIHSLIQFFSFALIAIGMPTTKVLMSFGLVFAIANWVLEGQFVQKWQIIRSNRTLMLLIGFYVLFIVGVSWSWDTMQGLKDLKSRLPFVFLPLIVATNPQQQVKYYYYLLYLFLATLLATSIFNVVYFQLYLKNNIYEDIRGMSRFASHIRYGLLIVLGICSACWLQWQAKKWNWGWTALAIWFTFYTFYSAILSSILALVLVVVVLLFYFLAQWKKSIAYLFAGSVVVGLGVLLFLVTNIQHEKIDCATLPAVTENGVPYNHECDKFSEINGKTIFAYYSVIELFHEWQKVSKMDLMRSDKRGGMLRVTCARYMTAMGLTKDKKGFQQLSAQDIRNIEDGYTYPNERNELLMPRLYGIKYQLLNNQDPNGHSLLQRLEHWKTSLYIIQHNWLLGVGTGGNQKAFDAAYEATNSPLSPENRVRSHNLFLTYGVSYGILGALFFILLMGALLIKAWKSNNLLNISIVVVLISSFLTEDTVETQLGVTLFGFFIALLFVNWNTTENKFN